MFLNDPFPFWDIVNILCRLVIIGIVISKLTHLNHMYNTPERIGLGVLGGSLLLTIPAVVEGANSPLSDWPSAVTMIGLLVYIVGRYIRQTRHARANRQAVANARIYLNERNKQRS